MNTLWIFQDSSYQQYSLGKNDEEVITIGNENIATIPVYGFPFKQTSLTLKTKENEDAWVVFEGNNELGIVEEEMFFTYENKGKIINLFLHKTGEETLYFIGSQNEITFSTSKEGMVRQAQVSGFDNIHSFTLFQQDGRWFVDPKNERSLFLNGKKQITVVPIVNGDILLWPFMTIRLVEGDLLQISSAGQYSTDLTETALPSSEKKVKYPLFQRTPRMIYELPKDKVEISFPGQDPEDDNRGLWLIILPPVMMLLIMGIIAFINPRGIFMLISLVMFTTTIFTSTVQYFRDKKKMKLKKERRLKVYTRYLEDKREELDALYQKQRNITYFHHPSFEEMKVMVSNISERTWERTIENDDFLQFRIGRADVPSSYKVGVSSNDMSNREIDDLLEDSQELVSVYKTVKNIPLSIQLASGSIGLVGKQSIVINELHQLIGQLAFFHSYHDIRFVCIFDEKDYSEWEWMKWLPHFQLPYSFAKGFIYNETTRDQLLTSIYQSIRDRDFDEDKEKKRFIPHYVFIVSNRNLIAEHVIMEYLEGKQTHIGISTIFVSDTKESLTENLHTLVQYINEREGEILIQDRKAVHTPFYLDQHKKDGNERFARTLGSLQHQIGMNNSIPEMVSFLQMFDAKNVEELNLQEFWSVNQSSQSLSVPIGLKGKNDQVVLNLHEKAHGPHGLVAGTTGSGKSEMLQTYILSMAVHFHPHEVAFLLIDYKGGGMALPFKNMPHLLGTITNIEGSKNFSNRALASINSELKKRQRLFGAYNVNHIDDYTDLYKQQKAEVPLPHLFLICDEFAELKNEEPEFIKELVSAARIGRSLGVHLILATQKPGGVIDNQIWSNARFRIALKVQDEGDSREVLKNGDAANITVTGRGYLQVGNNELYELFQSAWSGAPYMKDTFGGEDEVSLITDLGLIQLSEVKARTEKQKEKITEIDAVVNHILKTQEEMGIEKVASPWLPPLKERLYINGPLEPDSGVFEIARKDEPEKQTQNHYEYQWVNDGNIVIFGSSGYGKSTTALTFLLQFANSFSPAELNYFIFDFGNGALLPLKQLAHTADYFRIDEERKIDKFFTSMKQEIDYRKQLFLEKEVSNISLYNALNKYDKLPIIFIVIDNYDLVKDEMFDSEAIFTQFARDGQSLGINFVITATRVNAIRQPLMNSFKTKIFHYLMDSSEMYGVLGKTTFDQEPVPGRALIRKDETYFAQVYMPAPGENDVEILQAIREKVSNLNEKYEQINKPKSIPMLPTTLTLSSFESDYKQITDEGMIPIGLCEENVTSVGIPLKDHPHFLIMGQYRKGKSNSLKIILHMLLKNPRISIGIFDSVDRSLSSFKDYDQISYLQSKEHLVEWIASIEEIMKAREQQYTECLQNNEDIPVFDKVVFMIDSYSRFQQNSDAKIQDAISTFMKQYSYLGFSVIVSGNANEFSKGFDSFTNELKQVRQGLLLLKKSDQNLFTLPFTRNEKEIQPGFGYLIENGKERMVQIPHYIIERGE